MENVPPAFDVFMDGVPIPVRVIEVSLEDPADPDEPGAHRVVAEALEESKKGKTETERHVGVLKPGGEYPVGAVLAVPEEPASLPGYRSVDVVSVSCRGGKGGAESALEMFAMLKRAADLVDGRRLTVPSVVDHPEGDGADDGALANALRRSYPTWTPVPGGGRYVFGALEDGRGGAVQLTPTRAMLCALPVDASARPKPVQHIVSGNYLGPYVRRIIELDPPATTTREVWKRADCGRGNKHENWVPFVRISGTKFWLRCDSYAMHSM